MPLPYDISHYIVSFAAFSFIILAARQVGEFFARWNLPLISGYLLAGIIAGPFVLNFIELEMLSDLRFLEELSLAFIAFAAGSEMYLDELQGRLRSILWNTVMQLLLVFLIGGIAFGLLSNTIPFMRDLPIAGKIAAATLAGTILVARSPSSAIAIVNELRAKGPFTKTILGVTLVIDVVVVILFAISTSVAATLLTAESFDLSFFLLVGLELIGSLIIGLLVGRLLALILSTRLDQWLKLALILLLGLGVFAASVEIRHYSHDHLPFEILFEPLLICMVGSFWLTNRSPYRDEFRYLLHSVESVIFVIFFTLIGDSLDVAIVLSILPLAIAIFAARLLGLFIGGLAGGIVSGDPTQYNRLAWMVYITQAGVGLGLAKEVAIEFPQLGDDFTTIMVAVIVISQLVGPPFFKYAIKQVGEAHVKGKKEFDEVRDVLIVGIENQSHALAERLLAHNWTVILADIDPNHVNAGTIDGARTHLFAEISKKCLDDFITPSIDAVVAMLPDDDLNLRLCELAYEAYGVNRIVVRLNDYARAEEFRSLDAVVVYPSSAMVHLLDNVVRAPQLASLLLHDEPQNEVVQITITDPDIQGLHIRDVILPHDVLVVAIKRGGESIVPHGYTNLHLNDEVTLIGTPSSLKEVTLKLGY